MLSKNEAKYIQSLKQKKFRQQENLFIAEGPKLVNELINSNYTVRKLIATAKYQLLATKDIPVQVVEEHVFDSLSSLQTANQVLAIVEQKDHIEPDLSKEEIILCLDCIQDPGNLGTIIRIADWFGIKQLVCSLDTAELYNPKVIQSTMGSFLRVSVSYADIPALLQKNSKAVLGALMHGTSVYEQKTVADGILLIGNEGNGIRQELLPFINQAITIPGRGGAESLNAAVATGIILSHIL